MFGGADAGSADDCAADSAATMVMLVISEMVMLATVHRRRVPRRTSWTLCASRMKKAHSLVKTVCF